MTIAMRRTMLLLVGALFALAVVIAASARSGGDQAHATGPTKLVHVKPASLSQGCAGGSITGAHFVINQIAPADQPTSIQVKLGTGSTITVARTKSLSSVAQYTVLFSSPTTVVDATALVPTSWTGQFVLSNYICDGSSSSSSVPSSSSASTPIS